MAEVLVQHGANIINETSPKTLFWMAKQSNLLDFIYNDFARLAEIVLIDWKTKYDQFIFNAK